MGGNRDGIGHSGRDKEMRTLLAMGDYRVTTDGAWVDLWHGSELAQTVPASYFPKKTVDRVEFVTEMIHGEERALARFIAALEQDGHKVQAVDRHWDY